jgi:hypothetical protein
MGPTVPSRLSWGRDGAPPTRGRLERMRPIIEEWIARLLVRDRERELRREALVREAERLRRGGRQTAPARPECAAPAEPSLRDRKAA